MNNCAIYSIFLLILSASYLSGTKEDYKVKTVEQQLHALIDKSICIGFSEQSWHDIGYYVAQLKNAIKAGKIKSETEYEAVARGVNEVCCAYETRNNKNKMLTHLFHFIDAFEKINPKPKIRKKVLLPEEKFKRMYTKGL